LFPQTYS